MLVPVAIGLLALSGIVIGLRLITPCRLPRWASRLAWLALGALVVAVAWLPLSWYLPVDLDRVGLWHVQHWINMVAMGTLVLLGLAVAAREAILCAAWAARRIRARRGIGSPGEPTPGPGDMSRRQALAQGVNVGVLVAAGLLGASGFAGARRRAAVVRLEVPIAGLPAGLAGLRIVQLTDLHVGYTVDRPYVAAIVETVNALAADLIVITGDLTDGAVHDLLGDVEPMARLRSRHGTFFVTGNHDYFYGAAEEWMRTLPTLGITPLVNEHRLIEPRGGGRLLLAGVPDHTAGDYVVEHAPDPEASLRGAPEADARVLLAHQPRTIERAAACGFDLQLSGHTHGGQMFPFHGLALLRQPFLSGLHRVDRTWIYVSRGTGYWGPPFRTFAPSEITEVTLVRA